MMREQLSYEFIKGSGIEIGGLHCPLPVREGVKVTYVDLMPTEDLQASFPEVEVKKNEVILDSAETLSKFEDHSQDFVIANHVFEHCENPILTFKNWLRVLKPGGIIYAAIPDKRFTFDKLRPITPYTHLLKDFIVGPDHSIRDHYTDWFQYSELELCQGEVLHAKVEAAMKTRHNIHFHVWDTNAISEMIYNFNDYFDFKVRVIKQNGSEVIVIVQAGDLKSP